MQARSGGRGMMRRAMVSVLYCIPSIRNHAKSVEEQYSQVGVTVIRTTSGQVSYKLAPQAGPSSCGWALASRPAAL